MRQLLLLSGIFIGIPALAQSAFDKNTVTANEMRQMITEIFDSEKTKIFQQAEMQSGKGVLLLTNFEPGANSNDNQDVETALFEIANYPDLDTNVPIEFDDLRNAGSSRGERFEQATSIGAHRVENQLTFTFMLRDVPNKRFHSMIVIFQKEEEEWEMTLLEVETNS